MRKRDTAALRGRYAASVTASLGSAGAPVRAAFAAVPREDFLGPPPWHVLSFGASQTLAPMPGDTVNLADIYADVLVRLDAAKFINNGSPSLHAHMLHLLGVAPGEHVLHVGAGTGYYTAILAELVGAGGHVTAVEFDAGLAASAHDNLRPWPQATVVRGDGADFPTETVHRIYVNFALACPAEAWLDRLAIGGVLLFPLGAPDPDAQDAHARRSTGRAALLKVTRQQRGFAAAFDWPVAFVFAEGATAGDAPLRAALWSAFGRDDRARVHSLHRHALPAAEAWLSSPRFSLGYAPPD